MSRKKMRRSFCLIPQNLNILEDWDMIHLKGDIHRYVLSTSSFLCDIRELRYNQKNMGYQISRNQYSVSNNSTICKVNDHDLGQK